MKYLDPSFTIGGASEAFDAGYERTFGKKRERNAGKRFVYREISPGVVEAVEVGAEWRATNSDQGHKSEAEIFGNLSPANGVSIDSRTKHRNYLKATGLTMADDYRDSWQKSAEQRHEYFTKGPSGKGVRESIERAIYTTTNKRRK